MKNILYLLSLCTIIYSCGNDPAIAEEDLTGTWVLESVSGTCVVLPIDGTANDVGCIDNPTLEVNCSILEFKGDGIVSYAYSLVKGQGTYTIDGDGITICTDRCLDYTISGSTINLQTGTLPDCDPVYSFRKINSTLVEIIETNQIKKIKNVRRNGVIENSYTYYSDGKLQTRQRFNDEGVLTSTYNYSYTPISVTLTRTFLSDGSTIRYEYYNESLERKRRDYYDEFGNLVSYRLYFYEDGENCSYTRIEQYSDDNTLSYLSNYNYLDDQCSFQYTTFSGNQLSSVRTFQKDNNPAWWTAIHNPLFPVASRHNTTSYTSTNPEGDVSNSSYTEVFTYGSDGYPISSIKTYQDGDTELFTYEYE